MTAITRSTRMDAAPDAVWAVLADYAGISAWAPNVDHSSLLTQQDSGVGAVRRIQAGRFTLVEEATVWEPSSTLAYSLEGMPSVLKSVSNTWQIEPAGDGSAVSLTTDVNAGPRPPQQLIARLAARRLARASDAMLAGLKEHVS